MMVSLPSDKLHCGLALVFWMRDPPPPPNEQESKYAEEDYKQCKELWKNYLKCDFEAHEDPSRDDIEKAATKMMNNVDVTRGKYKYLAVTFIGHGGGGSKDGIDVNGGKLDLDYAYLVLKDGERCTVADLQTWFYNEYVQYRFFIMQACRGSKRETLSAADVNSQRQPYRSAVTTPSANMLTIYPSSKGNKNYYNKASGKSILVTNICNVFKEDYHLPGMDIYTMLLKVKKEVANWNEKRLRNIQGYEAAQTVFVEDSMIEKFCFSIDTNSGTFPSATGSSDASTQNTQASPMSLSDIHKHPLTPSPRMSSKTKKRPRMEDGQESDKDGVLLSAVQESNLTKVRRLLKNGEEIETETITVALGIAQKQGDSIIAEFLELAQKKKSQHKDGSSTTIEVKGSGNSTSFSGNASTTTNHYGENDEKKRRLQ